jgi:hypothetical protein
MAAAVRRDLDLINAQANQFVTIAISAYRP